LRSASVQAGNTKSKRPSRHTADYTPPAGFEPATLGLEVRQMQGFWLFLRVFEFSQMR
jgi:hypothetical protein